MAKDIIILDVNLGADGLLNVRCCFWIPNTKPVPKPAGTTSAYTGATDIENAAIRDNTIIEETKTFQFPNSLTQAQIQANILAFYNARVTWYASQIPSGKFYGIYHDSVNGWSS